MFGQKQENAIRIIQDAFKCCGLHSPVDRAWPFPGHGVEANACRVQYERERSCFDQWRTEEQLVAGMMLIVVILVFLWKVF
jgi:hypothetical protein